jgi:ring-1,2-phenylacetyl-CoA epoxidase subunit PaaC
MSGDRAALFAYLLRLGDSCLILGHRLAEWCGHAPMLELDLALTNIALDLTGQAQAYLTYAGEVEGRGRDADALAYLRDGRDFRNLLLVERPNEDFAVTILRQFLFDSWAAEHSGALARSRDLRLAGIAARAARETAYHERFSGEWVIRLGDGTDDSRDRAQRALDALWPYTGELFEQDRIDRELLAAGIAPDPAPIADAWRTRVADVLARATLTRPAGGWMQTGGRDGRHAECFGRLLAEMQVLPRSHPGAAW